MEILTWVTEICPERGEALAPGLNAVPSKPGILYVADFSSVCAQDTLSVSSGGEVPL